MSGSTISRNVFNNSDPKTCRFGVFPKGPSRESLWDGTTYSLPEPQLSSAKVRSVKRTLAAKISVLSDLDALLLVAHIHLSAFQPLAGSQIVGV